MVGVVVARTSTTSAGACDGATVGSAVNNNKALPIRNDGRSVGTLLGLRVGASVLCVVVVTIVTALVGSRVGSSNCGAVGASEGEDGDDVGEWEGGQAVE